MVKTDRVRFVIDFDSPSGFWLVLLVALVMFIVGLAVGTGSRHPTPEGITIQKKNGDQT